MKQVIQLLFFGLALGAWQDGVEIKSHLKRDELTKLGTFEGHPDDHLTLLSWTANSLFIGARDALFNISRSDLSKNTVLNWTVSAHHQEMCQFKGQVDSECHNFLRVLHGPIHRNTGSHESSSEGKYLVCGTNAFKPKCRWYSSDLTNYTNEISGIGYSPFDPTHKSTSVLHHGAVYAATVADFGGTDALIYKEPLRTEQYYDLHLNSPSFVSSLSYGDLALFFFREFAVEHANCGKAVFSRVARICRHDSGSKKHKDRFTTFLKARLNCSVPGEFPFYFDHIQGTTDIFMNTYSTEEMLYAVFTTPPNSIRGSAVCKFYTKDILRAFDGPFKGQSSLDSNWLPVPSSEVPTPRPGKCSNDPNQFPETNSLGFLKGHPLMDEAVQGTAVLTHTSTPNKFSAVAVDYSPEVAPYHILYIGTDSGHVLKGVVNASDSTSVMNLSSFNADESVISQSWEVFPESIKSLQLVSSKRLLVITETKMVIIRVDNCEKYTRCSGCLKIRDPHCAWDIDRSLCVAKDPDVPHNDININLIQDVSAGDINLCPTDEQKNEVIVEANHLKSIIEKEDLSEGEKSISIGTTTGSSRGSSIAPESDEELRYLGGEPSSDQIDIRAQNHSFHDNEIPRLNNFHQDFESSYVKSEEGSVSSQSVILATVSSAALSLMIGFALGFIASRWITSRQKNAEGSTNAQLTSTVNESQRLTKPIDFVVNVPSANKNPMKNNFNTDTLEKTVKKIYL